MFPERLQVLLVVLAVSSVIASAAGLTQNNDDDDAISSSLTASKTRQNENLVNTTYRINSTMTSCSANGGQRDGQTDKRSR